MTVLIDMIKKYKAGKRNALKSFMTSFYMDFYEGRANNN